MSDGVLTRALADLKRAGIPLAATLDPARRDDCLRAPGIGLKALERLQEAAAAAAELLPEQKRARGGAGRGQGRKPIQRGEDTVTVSLRLTTSQRAKLAALGGAAWVRQQIDAAGATVGVARRTWQDWERGQRRVSPGLFELFNIKQQERK